VAVGERPAKQTAVGAFTIKADGKAMGKRGLGCRKMTVCESVSPMVEAGHSRWVSVPQNCLGALW
jgi:hypothetical protein